MSELESYKNKRHLLKLKEEFVHRVWSGQKSFEIRDNDRDFQVGDTIVFCNPVGFNDEDVSPIWEQLKNYKITYIMQGCGIEEGYLVFSIEDTKVKP